MKKGDRVSVDNTARIGYINCVINDPEVGTIYMVKFSDTHRGMYPADRLTVVYPFNAGMKHTCNDILSLSPEGLKKLERRGREAYNKMSVLRIHVLAYMVTGGHLSISDLA